ncbi:MULTISPECIES: spore coat protein GerQ [Gracilibacillus]|uniref:spore coat protein GerQ n=1 Tax=Gracilibacillus TaxID=74385 RepID=UPI00082486AC|nr:MULTISPECIES: spore coat protein GerQ [Gracilibacillus]
MNQYDNQGQFQAQPFYPQNFYNNGNGMQQFPMQNQQTAPMTQQQQQQQQQSLNPPGMLPVEQSYIENILRLNRGKQATVYMTFENNDRWNAKIFKGIIEAAGRDHIILSDTETGKRYILLMVYLDYITFDEEIAYDYPYNMANNSPR